MVQKALWPDNEVIRLLVFIHTRTPACGVVRPSVQGGSPFSVKPSGNASQTREISESCPIEVKD